MVVRASLRISEKNDVLGSFPKHEKRWYKYYYKGLGHLQERFASVGISPELKKHAYWLFFEVVTQLEDSRAQACLEADVKLLLNNMGERLFVDTL